MSTVGKYTKKPFSRRERRPPSHPPAPVQDNPVLAEIAQWLSQVRFRKSVIGGLEPEDVWKKLEELNALYEKALLAERVRSQLLRKSQEETDGYR